MKYYARKQLIKYYPPLRNKIDIINLLLEIYTLSNLKKTKTTEEITIEFINEDWTNRILIYEDDLKQVQSFHTPFVLKEINNEIIITLEKGFFQDKIDDCVISFLKTIFKNINKNQSNYNEFLESFMDTFAEVIGNPSKENDYWSLVLYLLSFDTGYLRYDNDVKNSNGRIHPLDHLDINYDDMGTYKIGLYSRFSITDFENLFNKHIDSKYLEN